MSKFTDVVSGLAVAAVIATNSAVEKECEIVSQSTCEGAQIVTSLAEGLSSASEVKEHNDTIGNR